jgi:hypothetical protein
MKRYLLPLALAITSFISCRRVLDETRDILEQLHNHNKDKDTCQVIAQSSAYIEAESRSAVFGFRKVINAATGRVDSLITATGGTFEVDSVYYHFEYIDDNNVHIDGVTLTYNRLNSEQIWQLNGFSQVFQDVQLNADGHITVLTNGVQVMQQFNYEDGRLTSIDIPNDPAPFNHVTFSYDDHGNLVKMMRGDEQNNFSITYAYNLNHTANTQIYSPAVPFHVFEIMGWIPIAPVNLRTHHLTVNHNENGDVVIADITYSNHVIDSKTGALHSFDAHIGGIDVDTTIINTVECAKKK